MFIGLRSLSISFLLSLFLCLFSIGCSKPDTDMNSLIENLKDEDSSVRWNASLALAEIGTPAVEPLIVLLENNNQDVRVSAVYALGDIKDARAVEPLIAALSDISPDIREAAAMALEQIKDQRAVGPLIAIFSDSSPDVREAAVHALGQIKDHRAVNSLVTMLEDSDYYVREEAALALKNITGNTFVKSPRRGTSEKHI